MSCGMHQAVSEASCYPAPKPGSGGQEDPLQKQKQHLHIRSPWLPLFYKKYHNDNRLSLIVNNLVVLTEGLNRSL